MIEDLLAFDHHVVEVDGVRGILITYPWHTEPCPDGGLREALVLLNPSERHLQTSDQLRAAVDGHPDAPAHVQRLVDSLTFVPCGIPWQA